MDWYPSVFYRELEKKLCTCATITDGYTDGLVPVSILLRVGKKLRTCATITDGYTDELVPVSILPRVDKNLRSVPHSPTVSAHPEVHACQNA